MRLTGGRVFDPQKGFILRDVCLEGDRIVREAGGEVMDVTGCYVIPGLTDLHFHGCVGSDVSDADAEGLQKMADYELSRGVTQICPAGMTLPEEQLEKVCDTVAHHAATATSGALLVGLNLEGPFLSQAKKGAQNGAWLQKPNLPLLKRLVERSNGLAKLVSVAPELEGAVEFIEGARELCRVSIAHTTANYDTALTAFQAGARQVTHLYNAMPPFAHRDPGVIGAACDSEGVLCELISDGVHVHPAVVRATFRMMGTHRVILISDTMRAAGLSDGQYTLGGQDVTVTGRLAALADGTIAGSCTDLMSCMVSAVSFGVPLASAVIAAAVNPAKALGIYDTFGSLDIGKAANLVILNADLTLRAVIFLGKLL